jgi:hypothetical protein
MLKVNTLVFIWKQNQQSKIRCHHIGMALTDFTIKTKDNTSLRCPISRFKTSKRFKIIKSKHQKRIYQVSLSTYSIRGDNDGDQ